MALTFDDIHFHPLQGVSFHAPNSAIIGLIGERGSGASEICRLATGLGKPDRGTIARPAVCKWISESDTVSLSPCDLLTIDHSLAKYDAAVRARTCVGFDRLRRAGATILIAGHEEEVLLRICDEIWWIHEGRIAAKGDPKDTLTKYRQHVAARLEAWGQTLTPRLQPAERHGNKAAEVEALELRNSKDKATLVWASGDEVSVRVTLKFHGTLSNPVIGMLIRTRIGFEAFGTNTQLEGVAVGPRQSGDRVAITFQFPCHLCPGEYALTVASHDPDGTAHDWLDDALAFSVVDSRPTAGVANLRAQVRVDPA